MTATLKKAYGTVVSAASLIGQSRVPYLPREHLHQMRDRRLRDIVRYATETVPYYRDLFRREGIDPRDIRTAQDLDRLPLLDKDTVRRNPKLFVSEAKPGQTAVPFVTSGTTGAPLQIFHDRHSMLINTGFNEREKDVVRSLLGGRRSYTEAGIGYQGGTRTVFRKFLDDYRFGLGQAVWTDLYVSDPVKSVAAALSRLQPDLVSSYGSYLEAIFRMAAAGRIHFHAPHVVCYGADSMTDAGKRLIERDFGIPIVSLYNAVEAFKIGFTCEHGSGFHLREDLIYVKIVDGDGFGLGTGQKGEVVVTNLVNRGTVLLNYRLGDIASLSEERCPCGRTFVLLSELEGRLEDVVYLADGGFAHPRLVWKVFKHRPGVVRYQLIQHALDTFELRLATVDRAAFERVIDGVIEELHRLLGASVVIEATYQAEFQPYVGGKFRPVLSLLRDRGSHQGEGT